MHGYFFLIRVRGKETGGKRQAFDTTPVNNALKDQLLKRCIAILINYIFLGKSI